MAEQNTQTLEETTVSAPTTQQVVKKTKVVIPQAGAGSPQKEYQAKKAIFRTYQIIWYTHLQPVCNFLIDFSLKI